MLFGLDLGGILRYFSLKCWWLPAMFRPYESIGPASKIEGRGLNWGMILATKMHKKPFKKHIKFWMDFGRNFGTKWEVFGG